jgi:hypothetical protein
MGALSESGLRIPRASGMQRPRRGWGIMAADAEPTALAPKRRRRCFTVREVERDEF